MSLTKGVTQFFEGVGVSGCVFILYYKWVRYGVCLCVGEWFFGSVPELRNKCVFAMVYFMGEGFDWGDEKGENP